MSDNSRIPGIWWLSDNPDTQVAGDLLIREGKLELNGSFEGVKDGVFRASKVGLKTAMRDKTILGITRNGNKRFTLEYFEEPSYTYTMSSYGEHKADTYILGNIFEGAHFTHTDSISFPDYFVELPYLFEWVNESIISVSTVFSDEKPMRIRKSTVELEEPKDVLALKTKGFELSFSLYRGGLQMSPPFKDVHVSQGCFLRVKPAGTMTLTEARSIIRHFQRFLGIAVGKNVEPIRFEARTADKEKIILHLRHPSSADYKSMHLEEMNFTYSDITKNAQSVLEKWYSDKEKHADMFDLFSSISSESGKNINNQFRDIVSAIEGYVSVESGKLDVSPDKAVKTLNEYLPKEKRFITPADYKKIRITRNKLAHLTLKLEDEAAVLDNEGKWINAKRMIFLLEYALLRNLGVEDSVLEGFYSKKKWYLS